MPHGNDVQWARLLGVARAQVYEWRHGRRISAANADRLACALGLHPAEIWGFDAWLHASRPPRTLAEQRALDRARIRARRQEQRCAHTSPSTATG